MMESEALSGQVESFYQKESMQAGVHHIYFLKKYASNYTENRIEKQEKKGKKKACGAAIRISSAWLRYVL